MRISPVTNSYQPNFNGASSFRLKNGNQVVLNVLANNEAKVNCFTCDIFHQNKVVKQLNYQWKEGIPIEQLNLAVNKFCKKLGISDNETPIMLKKISDAYADELCPPLENRK